MYIKEYKQVPEKIKKFWSFIKSLKKDAYGITSLRENGILKTDSKEKANICNRQFQSAFTRWDLSIYPLDFWIMLFFCCIWTLLTYTKQRIKFSNQQVYL